MSLMFANDLDGERPICPLCKNVIEKRETPTSPAPAELVPTPKGLYLMHNTCVTRYNENVLQYRRGGE